MLTVYDKNGSTTSDNLLSAKLAVLINPTSEELTNVGKTIDYDAHVFTKQTSAAEVSHFSILPKCKAKDAKTFVSFNFDAGQAKVEDAIYPTVAILNSQQLILVLQEDPVPILEDQKAIAKLSAEDLLTKQLLYQNHYFDEELNKVKQQLDQLGRAARTTTKAKSLREATDLTRTLVHFSHTMDDQIPSIGALTDLLKEQHSANSIFIIDLLLSQCQITKRTKVYRDPLESISSLSSVMMDNHLNNLVKYLDSIALIISVPALISRIWGMNVGGLPGRNNEFDFLWVILFGAALAIISALFLRKKNHLK